MQTLPPAGRARYLRVAALGDSATYGIGERVPGGWRGWAKLLADALATSYDVSFCNLAVSGATTADVLGGQLDAAVTHRPDVASLIVGINDTMRSGWDPAQVRHRLMTSAETLHGTGALLLTARFHDHAAVLGLPRPLRRPMANRIEAVNRVYDEVHATFGGIRLDLATRTEVGSRDFWSVDRLHPSELGHRTLAAGFAGLLAREGLDFAPPSLVCAGGVATSWRQDVVWMVAQGAPWVGRRARDLGPWAVRRALSEVRPEMARPNGVGVGPLLGSAHDHTCRRPRRRRAPPDHDHPPLARPRRRLGAGRVRQDPRAVRGVRLRGRAALAQGLRAGLGHRRVRDAARLHQHPLRPRVGQGPHRRPHPRDQPADRPLAAGGHRLQGARREHDRARLRRAPGRRRHAHGGDHRGVRRPGRRRHPPAVGRRAHRRAADRLGGRGQRRHHRRRAAARPALRGGRPRRDRHERRDDRRRQVRRGAGHRRGRRRSTAPSSTRCSPSRRRAAPT